uniref:ARAD1C04774p n=1 Tax=Blastobotrys adeninivorans TaxID=409370 RepID=A0A060T5E0_BLAAD
MDQEQYVLKLIRDVQSSDGNTRKAAEQTLDSASRSDVDQFVLALVTIGAKPDIEVNLKQSALLLLKNAILRSWSIAFDGFEEPPISTSVKTTIRQSLVNLIGGPQRKVRSVSALLLSKIASVEYPDEWPDLVEQVLNLAQTGTPDQVHGALTVLKELLRESLSTEEFLNAGQKITHTLLSIASNSSYAYSSRASAVECFSSCVQFFLMVDDSAIAVSDVVDQTLTEWSDLFAQILAIPIESPGQAALIGLKLETLTCIRDMEAGFSKLVAHLVPLFSAVWNDLSRIEAMHTQLYVRETAPPVEPQSEDDVELMNDCTIEALVVSEISFFGLCLESENKQILDEFKSDMTLIRHFVALCIELGQMPAESPLADDNVNEFVTEEAGLSIDHTTRSELANVICLLNNENLPNALWEQIRVIFSEDARCDDLVKESCLYIFGQAITGGVPSFSRLPQHAVDGMVEITLGILRNADQAGLLLLSRAIILGSSLCAAFQDFVSHDVQVEYVQHTVTLGTRSSSPTIRSACLMGINKMQSLNRSDLKMHQKALFQIIASLLDIAAEDTPSFLVEVLLLVAKLDFEVSARSPEIVELLFTLASKDTANLELNTESTDVFEDIVENATKMGLYKDICSNTLPILLQALDAMQSYEYNPGIVLAIDLIGALVEKGPSPLPTEVLNHCLQPIYQIIMNTEDSQLMQAASETFTYLVGHASVQLKNWTNGEVNGPQLVLNVASRLLDPKNDDSATINSGPLINSIIAQYGTDVGPVLGRLVLAAANRLRTAENLVLVENLISVFYELALKCALDLVNLLWDLHMEDGTSALQVVLDKWLDYFSILRGSEPIRKSVLALQEIYLLNDDRVKNTIVEGDVVRPDSDVIITRSKARHLQKTHLPAQAKIVQVLTKELANTPYDASQTAIEDAVHSLDDDVWEDIGKAEFEQDLQLATPHQSDKETHERITLWLTRVLKENLGGIEQIYQTHLGNFEKDLIRQHCHL